MIAVGIDAGSTATKAVLIDGDKIKALIRPTGWSPRQAGRDIYAELLNREGYSAKQIDKIVATGYGRIALDLAQQKVTEITCHAKGAAFLLPGADMVIDVGGQDSKVIKIDPKGKVLDFAMNDKCAAGTGRFLQVTAAALGLDVSELPEFSQVEKPVNINNICTVFAESEIIGLLAQGIKKEAIVAGLHLAVAKRVAAMVKRMSSGKQIVFTGGVALNHSVQKYLEQELGTKLYVPKYCQLAGALGAALLGLEV
ncbi:acyl-CoA dehydratase activase [Bacillota bacterium LX-D]|nr:acyl-CoA dehydratase activase [Bacillota bacterium LX-D]